MSLSERAIRAEWTALRIMSFPHRRRFALEDVTFEFNCYSSTILQEIEVFFTGNSRGDAAERSFPIVVTPPETLSRLRGIFDSGRLLHTSHFYPGVPFELRMTDYGLGLLTLQDRCAILDLAEPFAICSAPESPAGDRHRRFVNTLLVPIVNAVLEQGSRFLMHSAALVEGEKSCLLAAASGGGKTTTTLALLTEHFAMLGDDLVIVDTSGSTPRLKAFSRAIRVLPDSLSLFPSLHHLRDRPLSDGKLEIRPSDISHRLPVAAAEPSLILFPEFDGPPMEAPFRQLTAAETVERLVPHALFIFGAHNWQQRMFAVMDLANHAAGYVMNNRIPPARIPALVRELLAQSANRPSGPAKLT